MPRSAHPVPGLSDRAFCTAEQVSSGTRLFYNSSPLPLGEGRVRASGPLVHSWRPGPAALTPCPSPKGRGEILKARSQNKRTLFSPAQGACRSAKVANVRCRRLHCFGKVVFLKAWASLPRPRGCSRKFHMLATEQPEAPPGVGRSGLQVRAFLPGCDALPGLAIAPVRGSLRK